MEEEDQTLNSISEQPQEHLPNPEIESSPLQSQTTSTRKKRGIYTSTTSPPNPWLIQDNHFRRDGGDNVDIEQLREEFLRREFEAAAAAAAASVEHEETVISECTIPLQSPTNSDQDTIESGIVEDVENIIGDYVVSPRDGVLTKVGEESGADIEIVDAVPKKRKYRKRKVRGACTEDDEYYPNKKHAGGIPKPTGDKAEEVLKAAKSLFSKRTRTLYHWMDPSRSKVELKSTVDSAWDTLPESEKHIYISQVLGRFGFPASNLMVNPQIGDFQPGAAALISRCAAAASAMYDPTKRVVDELLNSQRGPVEQHERRRGRKRQLRNEEPHEDFHNDPELNNELATFQLNVDIDANGDPDNLEIM